MGNLLITAGIILFVLGVIFNVLPKGQLPLLPGDIFIQRDNFNFYFPIVTSIVISILLTIILNLFK